MDESYITDQIGLNSQGKAGKGGKKNGRAGTSYNLYSQGKNKHGK